MMIEKLEKAFIKESAKFIYEMEQYLNFNFSQSIRNRLLDSISDLGYDNFQNEGLENISMDDVLTNHDCKAFPNESQFSDPYKLLNEYYLELKKSK